MWLAGQQDGVALQGESHLEKQGSERWCMV